MSLLTFGTHDSPALGTERTWWQDWASGPPSLKHFVENVAQLDYGGNCIDTFHCERNISIISGNQTRLRSPAAISFILRLEFKG